MNAPASFTKSFLNDNAYLLLAGWLLWCLSCFGTSVFLKSLFPETSGSTLFFASIITQLLFTAAQKPLLRKNSDMNAVTVAALFFDTITNIPGPFLILTRLPNTESYQIVESTLGITDPYGAFTALALSCGLGLLLAVGPELLWRSAKG